MMAAGGITHDALDITIQGCPSPWSPGHGTPPHRNLSSTCSNLSIIKHVYPGPTAMLSCFFICRFEVHSPDAYFLTDLTPTTGWTHIVLNYLGPSNGQGIRIYYNGTEVGSDISKTEEIKVTADGRIVVGRALTNYNDFYASIHIDELIFFNRALSLEEIRTIHAAA